MTWQIFILVQIIFASANTMILRSIAIKRQTHRASLAINAGMFTILYILALPVIPFLGNVDFNLLPRFLLWFIGGGSAFALGNIFFYKLLTHLDSGISTVLGTLSALFTIILAAAVLHEDLTANQAIGAFVLLIAIVYTLLIARHRTIKKQTAQSWLWGLWFALLSGIFLAAAIVNEKYLLGQMSLPSYMLFGWGGQALISLLAAILLQPQTLSIFRNRKILQLTVIAGVTRAIAGLFFVLSLIKSDNAALVTVIAQLRLIAVVIVGAWLLKEHQRINQKLVAALAAIIGLAFLFKP